MAEGLEDDKLVCRRKLEAHGALLGEGAMVAAMPVGVLLIEPIIGLVGRVELPTNDLYPAIKASFVGSRMEQKQGYVAGRETQLKQIVHS